MSLRPLSPIEQKVSEMWIAGRSTSEIGRYLNMESRRAATFIANCRERWPEAFPRRRERTARRASYMIALIDAVIAEHPDPRLSEVRIWLQDYYRKSKASSDKQHAKEPANGAHHAR